LQGNADRKTGGAQDGHKGGGLNPEFGQGSEHGRAMYGLEPPSSSKKFSLSLFAVPWQKYFS